MSKPGKFPDQPAFSDVKLFRLWIHRDGEWKVLSNGTTLAAVTQGLDLYLEEYHWFITRLDESVVMSSVVSDESIPQEQSK